MTIDLSKDETVFYKAVDNILWEEWDPIGVKMMDPVKARNKYL